MVEEGNSDETIRKWEQKIGGLPSNKIIFSTSHGLNADVEVIRSLNYEERIDKKVLNLWSVVSNENITFRTQKTPRRYFPNTEVMDEGLIGSVESDKNRTRIYISMRSDLSICSFKNIDLVYFPVMEHDEYFLVVFNLKKPSIFTIDYFPNMFPLTTIRDNDVFEFKDTAYKMKDMFVKYLESWNYPKSQEINGSKIERIQVKWAITNHTTEGRVVLMRHMETFMGREKTL